MPVDDKFLVKCVNTSLVLCDGRDFILCQT